MISGGVVPPIKSERIFNLLLNPRFLRDSFRRLANDSAMLGQGHLIEIRAPPAVKGPRSALGWRCSAVPTAIFPMSHAKGDAVVSESDGKRGL
jgi:hypothetical protein